MDTVGNMNIVVDKLFEKVKKLKQQSWGEDKNFEK